MGPGHAPLRTIPAPTSDLCPHCPFKVTARLLCSPEVVVGATPGLRPKPNRCVRSWALCTLLEAVWTGPSFEKEMVVLGEKPILSISGSVF